MEIKPTPDEVTDYNRYGKVPLGFYETTVTTSGAGFKTSLEPLDNCLEIRAAKELADLLEAVLRRDDERNFMLPASLFHDIRAVLRKAGRLQDKSEESKKNS